MLHLYTNKLPNYDDNTHIVYNNVDNYLKYLGTPFTSFQEDRYTINGNIAEVELPSLIDFNSVTYIAWNFGGGNVWRFFYVRNAVYQSGYAIFTLDVDLWATYYPYASLSNIRVTRCNRNVGVGLYDPIPVTQGREFTQLGDDIDQNSLSILYVVVYATGTSSIFVNNASTAISVFANILKSYESLDTWISRISGIFSAKATIGTLEASILKAYIVPTALLGNKSTNVPIFNSNTPYERTEVTPDFEVAPFISPVNFSIDIDPNYKYFVGTKHAGIELSRITGTANITYNFIVKQDGLQVIVQQGDKMLDITDSFQIGLTTNDGNLTSSQQIAKTLQTIGGVSSGAFQIAAGGAGYVTGALSIANALTSAISYSNARYTQGGDGINTYRSLSGLVQSPYYIQTNKSVDDEAANARLYGATFNTQLGSISEILNKPLLGTGTLEETYVAAELRVDGIPSDARDTIASAFRSGIYLISV